MKLELVPISFEEANAFVIEHHRHHGAVVGHKFSIASAGVEDGKVHGVIMVGRPVSRVLDNGWTLEVNRCCSDGTPNVCSMLYRAAWKACLALGFKKLITYTLQEECGSSLKASGFRLLGTVNGRSWSCPSRPRVDTDTNQDKFRWELP